MSLRPIHSVQFYYAVLVISLGLYHWPLLQFASTELNLGSWVGVQTLVTVLAVITLLSSVIFVVLLLFSRRLFKLVLGLIALANAAALYFMVTYQVIIDRTMVGNVLNTDASEAGELFHPNLLLYLVLFGLVPALLLWKLPIQKLARLRLAGHGVLVVALCLGWMAASGSTWLWIDKHAKVLGGMILPWGYMANTARFVAANNEQNQVQLPLPDLQVQEEGKRLVVLVIGETARAANFSYYGYERQTTPMLATTSTVALNNPVACTTYTTGSIRCMLAHANPEELDAVYEYLPSYLNRHDVDVIWRTNNWGEPPITVTNYDKASVLREGCKGGDYCQLDDVLLTGLKDRIAASSKDKILVVLHQKGSHGPSYNKRFTANESEFIPVCESVNLSECDEQSLVNAYDNTILHTDQFLYKTIQMLKDLKGTPSAFIYMSDHGESLGEHGLYLHGTPYSIAPDVQKQVPMLVWMSPKFKAKKGLQNQDINWRQEHTHSNIFHSVIGAMGYRKGAYDSQQDIFSIE